MKKDFEEKLDKIADIWNYFILEYHFCSIKIKFNEDAKTNYLGDILGYFKDTIDIVTSEKRYSNYTKKFSFTISFLQAIYIQQDFVEEILELFKTGIEKGDLKQDLDYSINRDIRNELVGHPIRKQEGKLISSTLFSYQAHDDEIEYLRYHKDNSFKYESRCFKIVEIQKRHINFLNKYFDFILIKLKTILDEYFVELDKLAFVIRNNDFNTVVKLVELYFESIFKSDFLYDKDSLLKIYERRLEHSRYQNFIDKFYADLKIFLIEKRSFSKTIFEEKKINPHVDSKLLAHNVKIVVVKPDDSRGNFRPLKQTYHYEIGKIATMRNSNDFQIFGGLLKSRCKGNKIVEEELSHMELNITNEIEYYTSLRLICKELNEE